jgi:hypothetical protein
MSSECSTAAVPAGGNGRTNTGLCSSTAGASPPENSGTPHGAPGKNPWWKANAGMAITASISAETNATAKNLFTLLKANLLFRFPAKVHTQGDLHRLIASYVNRCLEVWRLLDASVNKPAPGEPDREWSGTFAVDATGALQRASEWISLESIWLFYGISVWQRGVRRVRRS